MPLDKKSALEYLERAGRAIRCKELSVDLDSRASTASELLERCVAQGLCRRDPSQRPREYSLTDAGRKRLEFFRSAAAGGNPTPQGADQGPDDAAPSNGNTGASASGAVPSNLSTNGPVLSEKLDGLREEICSRLDVLREDFRDLLDTLAAKPSSRPPAPTETLTSRVEALLKRAEGLQARKLPHPKAREFYTAVCARDNAPTFSFSNPARRSKVAELEKDIPAEVVASVKALRELELHDTTLTPLTADEEKEIARLRAELGLSLAKDAKAGVKAE